MGLPVNIEAEVETYLDALRNGEMGLDEVAQYVDIAVDENDFSRVRCQQPTTYLARDTKYQRHPGRCISPARPPTRPSVRTHARTRTHVQEDGDEIVRRVKAELVPQKAAAQTGKEVTDM